MDIIASILADKWNGPIRCFSDDGTLSVRLTIGEAQASLLS